MVRARQNTGGVTLKPSAGDTWLRVRLRERCQGCLTSKHLE